MPLTVSPLTYCSQKNGFLQIILIFGVMFSSNLKTFLKPCYFSFSKTLLFCLFIIFNITQGTRIPSNYINFMETADKWIDSDITRLFFEI